MAMHKISEIDTFDEKILHVLQSDARKTSIELAEVVGLSPSSCQRRQRDLEQRGIIRGYRADIDPAVLSQSFTVFAAVQLGASRAQRRSSLLKAAHIEASRGPRGASHRVGPSIISGSGIAVADLASYEISPRRSFDGAAGGGAHHFSYVVMSGRWR